MTKSDRMGAVLRKATRLLIASGENELALRCGMLLEQYDKDALLRQDARAELSSIRAEVEIANYAYKKGRAQ